jgi:hypothetical protein
MSKSTFKANKGSLRKMIDTFPESFSEDKIIHYILEHNLVSYGRQTLKKHVEDLRVVATELHLPLNELIFFLLAQPCDAVIKLMAVLYSRSEKVLNVLNTIGLVAYSEDGKPRRPVDIIEELTEVLSKEENKEKLELFNTLSNTVTVDDL